MVNQRGDAHLQKADLRSGDPQGEHHDPFAETRQVAFSKPNAECQSVIDTLQNMKGSEFLSRLDGYLRVKPGLNSNGLKADGVSLQQLDQFQRDGMDSGQGDKQVIKMIKDNFGAMAGSDGKLSIVEFKNFLEKKAAGNCPNDGPGANGNKNTNGNGGDNQGLPPAKPNRLKR